VVPSYVTATWLHVLIARPPPPIAELEDVVETPPGECEGNIGCYLSRIGLLEGTYLREEPHGRHAHDAMLQLADRVSHLADGPRRPDFDSATDCPEILQESSHLREIVEGSGVAGGDRALEAPDRLAKNCGP
jgi:hypothetical protein